MVAIKDMEMPSDCMECMFCNHIKSNDYGTYGDCAILGDKERMNLLLHQKHSDCPLVEIEERKGKWIRKPIRNYKGGCIGAEMICSCCNKDNRHDEYMDFCPKCGAEMIEVQSYENIY